MLEELLQAESLAARIEAACRAEPELGQLWRAETAIAEAIASVGLDGVRIDTADLLPRVALNRPGTAAGWGAETRDAEMALLALRLLKSPGNPFQDPVACVRRLERLSLGRSIESAIERAWASERTREIEEGELPSDGFEEEPDPDSPQPTVSDQEILTLLASVKPEDPPLLGAIRVAAGYRALCPGGEPMVERSLFMAVEGGLRHQAWFGLKRERRTGASQVAAEEAADDGEDLPLRGLSEGVAANWVAAPSVALTRGTFRLWDPGTLHGVRSLLSGLVGSLRLDLGRLIGLREWLHRAQAAGQGRTGRSRLRDASRLFAARPLMNSADLANQLGITQRGATNLAEELARLGLLREVTQRRAARIWATPEIARMLAPPTVTKRMRAIRDLSGAEPPRAAADDWAGGRAQTGDPGRVGRDWALAKARHEERLERIYKDLDRALAHADTLLHLSGREILPSPDPD